MGYTLVEALKDIPQFLGSDGNKYQFNVGDVRFIPTLNAEGLEHKKAILTLKTKYLRILNSEEFKKYIEELKDEKKENLIHDINETTFQIV